MLADEETGGAHEKHAGRAMEARATSVNSRQRSRKERRKRHGKVSEDGLRGR